MLSSANSLGSANSKKAIATTTKTVGSFDGTGDYFDISSIADSLNYTQGSVSMWVNINQSDSNEAFFSACATSNSGANKIELQYLTGSEKYRFIYKEASNTHVAEEPREKSVVESEGFIHLVGVYNTTTNQLSLYVNGNRNNHSSTVTIINQSDHGAISNVHLGKRADASGTFHNGKIGEVAVYSDSLTDDEVLEIYNGGKTFDHNNGSARGNLVAWYKFGTGIVGGIQDSSSAIFNCRNLNLTSEIVDNHDLTAHGTASDHPRLGSDFSIDDWTFEKNSSDDMVRTYTGLKGEGIRCTVTTAGTGSAYFQRIYHSFDDSDMVVGKFYVFTAQVLTSDGSQMRVAIQKLTSAGDTTNTPSPTNINMAGANVPTIIQRVFKCIDATDQKVHIFPLTVLGVGEYYEVHFTSLREYPNGAGTAVADASLETDTLR